jgi:tetratricopeptide (TPR) repeat protein
MTQKLFVTSAAPAYHGPVREALSLRAQGRLREALAALAAPDEFSTDAYILRGDLQMELGLIQEAAGSYFTVTASDPSNMYAQSHLGDCLYRLARWEPAADAFRAVLNFDPHRDELRLDLGECFLNLKRYEDALSCFDQCWSDVSRKRAVFGRAIALQQLRRYDEAIVNYERLLALDPGAEEALANLVAIGLEVFDLGCVNQYARRLLELNPRSVTALKALALTAMERRDFGIAAGYFSRATELDPEILRPGSGNDSADSSAVEYRISRKVFETLLEAAKCQPGPMRAAAGR